MIVTSNGFRAGLFFWFTAKVPRTKGSTVLRWGKTQRRAAKTLTVAHFQRLALNAR
jgi:hypothetical protein